MVEYVLCAHIADTSWICTRGNFINSIFQADDPFGEDSLTAKDLRDNRISSESGRRRRIAAHLHKGQLKKLIEKESAKWDLAVAKSKLYYLKKYTHTQHRITAYSSAEGV